MPKPHDPSSDTPNAAAAFDAAVAGSPGFASSGGLPIIQCTAGELPRMVDEAEKALIGATDFHLFQRGPLLVRVVRRAALASRSSRREEAGELGITMVDAPYLLEQMTRCARWEKFDGRAEEYRRVNAPEVVAKTYIARSGEWKLPHLHSVLSAPTLRADGSILQTPGYDQATATWFDPCGVVFPKIPEKPTNDQVAKALDELVTVLDTMPFVDEVDRSVALALMLTSLVRRSLPSAPMGAITAPTPGSGKSLLADCIGILCTGQRPSAMTFPSNDEEAEKVALTLLLGGDAVGFFDNVQRPVEGDWLCTILTSETYQARLLGRNEKVSVPTSALFLVTGNALLVKGDLRRRTLLCRIDPKHERPHERKFDSDLKEMFRAQRARLVAAGLTLIRGYLVNGERASVFRPWGSFEQWSTFCREPLLWRGLSDPCDSYQAMTSDDPERQAHEALMLAWAEYFGDEGATASEAISRSVAAGTSDLGDALRMVARERGGGGVDPRKLGAWLRDRSGRVLDGKCIENAGKSRGTTKWRVVERAV